MVYRSIGAEELSWGGRTYPEIGEVAESEGSIFVLPVGSIEQHGHHLPTATDTILVDAIAQNGADRVAEDVPVLVAPPVWSGYSPHHQNLGGTLTLDFETLLHVVEDITDAALELGFDAVLLLNGHGGNISLINSAVSTIGTEHGDVEVTGLTYFQLAASFIDDIRESDLGGIAHAGEFETSLMYHLRPDLVRKDEIKVTYGEDSYDHASPEMFDGGPLGVYRSFEEYSATGEIGDPTLASAEKGEELFERLLDELEVILRQLYEQSQD